jgi:hypothetical protein
MASLIPIEQQRTQGLVDLPNAPNVEIQTGMESFARAAFGAAGALDKANEESQIRAQREYEQELKIQSMQLETEMTTQIFELNNKYTYAPDDLGQAIDAYKKDFMKNIIDPGQYAVFENAFEMKKMSSVNAALQNYKKQNVQFTELNARKLVDSNLNAMSQTASQFFGQEQSAQVTSSMAIMQAYNGILQAYNQTDSDGNLIFTPLQIVNGIQQADKNLNESLFNGWLNSQTSEEEIFRVLQSGQLNVLLPDGQGGINTINVLSGMDPKYLQNVQEKIIARKEGQFNKINTALEKKEYAKYFALKGTPIPSLDLADPASFVERKKFFDDQSQNDPNLRGVFFPLLMKEEVDGIASQVESLPANQRGAFLSELTEKNSNAINDEILSSLFEKDPNLALATSYSKIDDGITNNIIFGQELRKSKSVEMDEAAIKKDAIADLNGVENPEFREMAIQGILNMAAVEAANGKDIANDDSAIKAIKEKMGLNVLEYKGGRVLPFRKDGKYVTQTELKDTLNTLDNTFLKSIGHAVPGYFDTKQKKFVTIDVEDVLNKATLGTYSNGMYNVKDSTIEWAALDANGQPLVDDFGDVKPFMLNMIQITKKDNIQPTKPQPLQPSKVPFNIPKNINPFEGLPTQDQRGSTGIDKLKSDADSVIKDLEKSLGM